MKPPYDAQEHFAAHLKGVWKKRRFYWIGNRADYIEVVRYRTSDITGRILTVYAYNETGQGSEYEVSKDGTTVKGYRKVIA